MLQGVNAGVSKPMNLAMPQFGQVAPKHRKVSIDASGNWVIPDHVIIPYIPGEGIGPEIIESSKRLIDQALKLSYGNRRSIQWKPLLAGIKAQEAGKDILPQETIDEITDHHLFVKGPLATPLGGGHRSINVTLRKMFDLFACIRPVRAFDGVESPLKNNKLDVVIFRENTEDLYAGIEFEQGSPGAKKLQALLKELGHDVPDDAGLGIKPISESASKRIVQKAIQYAIDSGRPSVTVMHKANIMKYTEGAFLKWAREVAKDQFPDKVVLAEDFQTLYGGDMKRVPKGNVVLQEVIADNMFQQLTLNPQNHSVIVTMNLNGDYISDDAAANVGGLGLAPGANIGDKYAMFEATHGTAPDIAGQNKANPSSMFLTTIMMLNHMGWSQAGDRMLKGMEAALAHGSLTGDLARNVAGAKALSTTAFTDAVIAEMHQQASNPFKADTAPAA